MEYAGTKMAPVHVYLLVLLICCNNFIISSTTISKRHPIPTKPWHLSDIGPEEDSSLEQEALRVAEQHGYVLPTLNEKQALIDSCSLEEILASKNQTVHLTEWNYGRLGNAINSVTKAMIYAARYRCHLILPPSLIGVVGYTVPRRYFCAPALKEQRSLLISSLKLADAQSICSLSKPSAYWWDQLWRPSDALHPLIQSQLRAYLGLNATHSFGFPCPNVTCIGVHIRSGDGFRGVYNDSDGHWISNHVHAGYEQPPLEYYLKAIRNFLKRNKQTAQSQKKQRTQMKHQLRRRKLLKLPAEDDIRQDVESAIIKIACEDFLNPVCEIFQTLAETDPSIQFTSQNFLSTLQELTCCEEIIVSRSTLSFILTLSPRLKHLHYYDDSGPHRFNEDCQEVTSHYGLSLYQALGYNFTPWHNSELERHHMLQPYKMEVHTCDNT
jgi:hypothetical protein